ncbi:hypothetical protein [Microbacterium plantarum]|uniref:Uncharacterized protein n=1 Tax=Microbacterium plantarum TaxID=1816425 RepID=A0ABV5EUF1_9MICO
MDTINALIELTASADMNFPLTVSICVALCAGVRPSSIDGRRSHVRQLVLEEVTVRRLTVRDET